MEQIWSLMYYIGFTYQDAYKLPIWKRIWFLERTVKEFKKANDEGRQVQSKAAHNNSPEQRAMNGNSRSHAPARLRRFT